MPKLSAENVSVVPKKDEGIQMVIWLLPSPSSISIAHTNPVPQPSMLIEQSYS